MSEYKEETKIVNQIIKNDKNTYNHVDYSINKSQKESLIQKGLKFFKQLICTHDWRRC